MSVDRESLRDNARYLRNVRPVDPEEVYEYLPDQPHPAVVRRALREEAFDLGLRERDDGTFVPVTEEPVPAPGWEPTAFPEQYDRAVESALIEAFGREWYDGDSGHQLRERIRELKENYYRGQAVSYDEEAALAYAVYHGADFYAATGYCLDPLARRGLLDRRLRVLDVGAGTGGPALAIHDYLPDDAVVDYHAVEPSANADVFETVVAETGRNFRTTVHRTTAEALDPAEVGGVDLLVFGNVLSELDAPAATVQRYCETLTDDGTCLLLAPADLETATNLRSVERSVVDGSEFDVYAPTLRLWPDASPSDDGWSFDERTSVTPPATQEQLAGAARPDEFPDREDFDAEQFRNGSVRFAYALLRRDGERRLPVRASPDRHARLAEAETHVTNRVNCLVVKLSRNLADGGNPVYRVGDGSQTVDHYAVSTRESVLNEELRTAPYGTVLSVENVLVLWNDDEEAYNLVCDAETVVDSLG
ncbi:methyltransferase [Halobaculum sp. MBLA0143]|uniref:methyltransferase n=1 Tax=Halobaculum sp. MBLA0143 TaxID=3079933 RepID=UPI0035252ACF